MLVRSGRPDQQDRQRCAAQDLLSHAAKDPAPEAASPVGYHGDQVDLLAEFPPIAQTVLLGLQEYIDLFLHIKTDLFGNIHKLLLPFGTQTFFVHPQRGQPQYAENPQRQPDHRTNYPETLIHIKY